MSESITNAGPQQEAARWEYRVRRVVVGPVTYQKYGPDTFDFEATLNEWGAEGWEAFHVQAFAEGEALLLFLKRRVVPAS